MATKQEVVAGFIGNMLSAPWADKNAPVPVPCHEDVFEREVPFGNNKIRVTVFKTGNCILEIDGAVAHVGESRVRLSGKKPPEGFADMAETLRSQIVAFEEDAKTLALASIVDARVPEAHALARESFKKRGNAVQVFEHFLPVLEMLVSARFAEVCQRRFPALSAVDQIKCITAVQGFALIKTMEPKFAKGMVRIVSDLCSKVL